MQKYIILTNPIVMTKKMTNTKNSKYMNIYNNQLSRLFSHIRQLRPNISRSNNNAQK